MKHEVVRKLIPSDPTTVNINRVETLNIVREPSTIGEKQKSRIQRTLPDGW